MARKLQRNWKLMYALQYLSNVESFWISENYGIAGSITWAGNRFSLLFIFETIIFIATTYRVLSPSVSLIECAWYIKLAVNANCLKNRMEIGMWQMVFSKFIQIWSGELQVVLRLLEANSTMLKILFRHSIDISAWFLSLSLARSFVVVVWERWDSLKQLLSVVWPCAYSMCSRYHEVFAEKKMSSYPKECEEARKKWIN